MGEIGRGAKHTHRVQMAYLQPSGFLQAQFAHPTCIQQKLRLLTIARQPQAVEQQVGDINTFGYILLDWMQRVKYALICIDPRLAGGG
jgi:hypothetical protein